MKKSLYSIRDEVAEEFGEPFMAVNDNVARRCYLLGLSKVSPEFMSDYKLFRIGEFDDQSGCVSENVPVEVDMSVGTFPAESEK